MNPFHRLAAAALAAVFSLSAAGFAAMRWMERGIRRTAGEE